MPQAVPLRVVSVRSGSGRASSARRAGRRPLSHGCPTVPLRHRAARGHVAVEVQLAAVDRRPVAVAGEARGGPSPRRSHRGLAGVARPHVDVVLGEHVRAGAGHDDGLVQRQHAQQRSSVGPRNLVETVSAQLGETAAGRDCRTQQPLCPLGPDDALGDAEELLLRVQHEVEGEPVPVSLRAAGEVADVRSGRRSPRRTSTRGPAPADTRR